MAVRRRLALRLAGLTMVAVLLSASAACGSNDSDPHETPTSALPPELATREAENIATAQAALLTPAVVPTVPSDANAVPMREVTGRDNSYTMQVPEDWDLVERDTPLGWDAYYIGRDNVGAQRVQVVVRCAFGATVDALAILDNNLIKSLDGSVTGRPDLDRTISGQPARAVDIQVGTAGLRVKQRAYYFEREPCGWRITLMVFDVGGGEEVDPYQPLFTRIVDSFTANVFEDPKPDRLPYPGLNLTPIP